MKSQNRKHRTCSHVDSDLTVSFKLVMELGCLVYRSCRSLKRYAFSLLLRKVILQCSEEINLILLSVSKLRIHDSGLHNVSRAMLVVNLCGIIFIGIVFSFFPFEITGT